MDDLDRLRQSFFIEAEDILENIDALLLDLEKEPEDGDLLNAIFRNMHTLKGSSGIFEFHELERTAHVQEDLLDYIRTENISPSTEIIDILFEGLDLTKLIYSMIKEGNEIDEGISDDLESKIREFLPEKEVVHVEEKNAVDNGLSNDFMKALADRSREKAATAAEEGKRLYQITMAFNKDCLGQGIDPLLLLKTLSYDGEVIEIQIDLDDVPPISELEPDHLYFRDISTLFSTDLGYEEVDNVFEFAHEAGRIELHQLSPIELKEHFGFETDEFWLESQGKEESGTQGNDQTDFNSDIVGQIEIIETSLINLEKNPNDQVDAEELCTLFQQLKKGTGQLKLKSVEGVVHFAESIVEKIREGKAGWSATIIDSLRKSMHEIKEIVDSAEGETRPVSQETTARKLGEILVDMGELTEEQLAEALEKQQMPLGKILVQEGMVSNDKVEKALEKQRTMGTKGRTAIKVDTGKLDNLVNLVGELVIAQTIVSHNKSLLNGRDNGISKTISHLNKITRDIQEEVMSMRMLPIRATFQKLMRVARDVTRKAGKEVEVRVFGEETELDKTVIDEIGDPLLHILRNAADHGIEVPQERLKAGKPRKGTIELKAFHQGGNIVVEISEDGVGLDKEVILKKAIDKGLVSGGEDLSDQQIFNLIFEAGFSTAETITNVSGRGVGMDVVKRSIEKLRGKVDIQTRKGEGTTFTISLPLTLAVIDGMVVKVGDERYIIPTISIVESIKPDKEQVFTVKGKGEMINVRGELFPMMRLHEIFNVGPNAVLPWDSLVILVEGEGKKGCLLVDELLGQQQVVIKSLGDGFKKLRGISGGSILGDGRVGLILDTGGILDIMSAEGGGMKGINQGK